MFHRHQSSMVVHIGGPVWQRTCACGYYQIVKLGPRSEGVSAWRRPVVPRSPRDYRVMRLALTVSAIVWILTIILLGVR